MRSKFLSFSSPNLGEEEIAEVVDTLRSDWISTGPKTRRFELEFAARVGAPAALAVNSCTGALHLALAALGVGPGDVVITTPLTFCSGIHVIEHLGARPVLVDVEPDTLNLDPARIRETLEKLNAAQAAAVKAILPVHLYGHACDMDAILEVARERRLAIVEDAAHALPAYYHGHIIGSLAATAAVPVISCFSFYATKNLTTAEGGMLSGPPELVEEARLWSLQGMSRDAWKRYGDGGSWDYEVTRPGFKYNMTDIQAALGLQQLRKLSAFHVRRLEIARRYNDAFAGREELQIPTTRPAVEHAWHLYALRLNPDCFEVPRRQFIEELKVRNIAASVHFIPVHLHPYYRDKYGYKPADFPVAYREYQRLVSLPLFPAMTDRDVSDVIEAVLDIVEKHRARRGAVTAESWVSV